MKRRLLQAAQREDGLSFEAVIEKLGVNPSIGLPVSLLVL
jgi:hypothetical protein